ncbi:MAG: DUF2007 domain-containing protein [Thermodesulfobacteriota bacterium]
MITLTTIENRFEADLITAALTEEGIEFVLRTFEDRAYDGLFVTQKGFGRLLVHESDQAAAQAIVDAVRASVSGR